MATQKELLKKSLEQQKKVYKELLAQNKLQAQQGLNSAKTTQEASNRGASSDYYGYINPYGIQSEAMARSGLKNSGLTQTNLSNAYSDYQNRLGQSASAYAQSEADINAALSSANSGAKQDYLNTKSQYYADLAALKNSRSSGSGGSSGGGSSSYSLTGNNGNNAYGLSTNQQNMAKAGLGLLDNLYNTTAKKKTKKNTTQTLLEKYGGDNWYNYF